jgi:hypothetical protein
MSEPLTDAQVTDFERQLQQRKFAASYPSLPVSKVDPDSFIGRAQAAQRARAAESVRVGQEREAALLAEREAEAARQEQVRQEARHDLARLAPKIEKREADRTKANAEAAPHFAAASESTRKGNALLGKDKKRHAALDELVARLEDMAR